MDTTRKWDLLSKEERTSVIKRLITFFQEERGEEIGNIASRISGLFFTRSRRAYLSQYYGKE